MYFSGIETRFLGRSDRSLIATPAEIMCVDLIHFEKGATLILRTGLKLSLPIKAMFCIYLRTNSDLCHLQHKLIGFYNRDEKCLQRGTDWVFK